MVLSPNRGTTLRHANQHPPPTEMESRTPKPESKPHKNHKDRRTHYPTPTSTPEQGQADTTAQANRADMVTNARPHMKGVKTRPKPKKRMHKPTPILT